MIDFTPNLEAQQKSIEAMLNNLGDFQNIQLQSTPPTKEHRLSQGVSYNEFYELTGKSIKEYGSYIVGLQCNT